MVVWGTLRVVARARLADPEDVLVEKWKGEDSRENRENRDAQDKAFVLMVGSIDERIRSMGPNLC